MGRTSAGFLTHIDIDRLLGGGSAGARHRQRLTREGLLPEPRWVQAGRTRLGLFASPALARLVVGGRAGDEYEEALGQALESHAGLIYTRSFDRVVEAIVAHLFEEQGDGPGARLDRLTYAISQSAPADLEIWHRELADAETRLSHFGIDFTESPGRVIDAEVDHVTIQMKWRTTRISPDLVTVMHLNAGLMVAVNEWSVLGRGREFVVPLFHLADPLEPSPFQEAVRAVLDGEEQRRLPHRFVGDPDAALAASEGAFESTSRSDQLAARFAEGAYAPEARRSGFGSSRKPR